jgi:hypothetical protein
VRDAQEPYPLFIHNSHDVLSGALPVVPPLELALALLDSAQPPTPPVSCLVYSAEGAPPDDFQELEVLVEEEEGLGALQGRRHQELGVHQAALPVHLVPGERENGLVIDPPLKPC